MNWQPLNTAPEATLLLLLVNTGTRFPRAIISGYYDNEYRPPIKGERRWLDPHHTSLIHSGLVPLCWAPLDKQMLVMPAGIV